MKRTTRGTRGKALGVGDPGWWSSTRGLRGPIRALTPSAPPLVESWVHSGEENHPGCSKADEATRPTALPTREELAVRKRRRKQQEAEQQPMPRPFEGLRLPDLETLERLSRPDALPAACPQESETAATSEPWSPPECPLPLAAWAAQGSDPADAATRGSPPTPRAGSPPTPRPPRSAATQTPRRSTTPTRRTSTTGTSPPRDCAGKIGGGPAVPVPPM